MGWNHNVAYHDVAIRAVPWKCGRALDVGCGEGALVEKLRRRCGEVVGIDLEVPAQAGFVAGDVLTYPFAAGSFELVTCVAVLHHLPLEAGLQRLRQLLAPGGVLVVVGLYRADWLDCLTGMVALPVSWMMGWLRGREEMRAAMTEPRESLGNIRRVVRDVLPGAKVRRRLFFRYTVIWRR